MKILIDMNLSHHWAEALKNRGIEAVCWSGIAAPDAPDTEIMAYAEANGYAVFTRDLDFGDLLAATRVSSPSVILIRGEDIRPETMLDRVTEALARHTAELAKGVIISITPHKTRSHILPFDTESF